MRLLGILILLSIALMFGCHSIMTRSATIELEGSGYDLTYTIHWGMGMEQSFSLVPKRGFSGTIASGNIEIIEGPDNSGMAVYRSADGRKYYFGLGYGSFAFDASSRSLSSECEDALSLTDLGRELRQLGRDPEAIDLKDPGRTSVYGYLEPDQLAYSPSQPTASRYYVGIMFLGKLGLIRPPRGGFQRGENVGFAPSERVQEPRLALSCAG